MFGAGADPEYFITYQTLGGLCAYCLEYYSSQELQLHAHTKGIAAVARSGYINCRRELPTRAQVPHNVYSPSCDAFGVRAATA
jgi:hypothetical protein